MMIFWISNNIILILICVHEAIVIYFKYLCEHFINFSPVLLS